MAILNSQGDAPARPAIDEPGNRAAEPLHGDVAVRVRRDELVIPAVLDGQLVCPFHEGLEPLNHRAGCQGLAVPTVSPRGGGEVAGEQQRPLVKFLDDLDGAMHQFNHRPGLGPHLALRDDIAFLIDDPLEVPAVDPVAHRAVLAFLAARATVLQVQHLLRPHARQVGDHHQCRRRQVQPQLLDLGEFDALRPGPPIDHRRDRQLQRGAVCELLSLQHLRAALQEAADLLLVDPQHSSDELCGHRLLPGRPAGCGGLSEVRRQIAAIGGDRLPRRP